MKSVHLSCRVFTGDAQCKESSRRARSISSVHLSRRAGSGPYGNGVAVRRCVDRAARDQSHTSCRPPHAREHPVLQAHWSRLWSVPAKNGGTSGSDNDHTLTIQGERKEEKEEKKENYYFSERSYGAFARALPLPAGVEADKVKGDLQEGRGQGGEGQEDRGEGFMSDRRRRSTSCAWGSAPPSILRQAV